MHLKQDANSQSVLLQICSCLTVTKSRNVRASASHTQGIRVTSPRDWSYLYC